MASPVMECTEEKEWFVIRYVCLDGVKTGESYGRMIVQNDDICVSEESLQMHEKITKESGWVLAMTHVLLCSNWDMC
jgi:hypothetical protein